MGAKKCSVLFLLIFLCLIAMKPVMANTVPPSIVGEAAIVIDSSNGQILYEKESHKRMYPASTTKALTAIIALENGNLSDKVRIPREACDIEGSAIGLHEGELISLEDLLYALMLHSGNDAAVAIAVHVGGSVGGFVDMMNRKAAELLALDSHFNNPNGLPDINHYTSAHDLSLIARYAMQNREFRKIVSTETTNMTRTYPGAQTIMANSNKMLWRYPGSIGVKTGYTDDAGQCLIAAANRQDRELITVVLGSVGQSIYDDSMALMEHGFNGFELVSVIQEGKHVADIPVKYGIESSVPLIAGRSINYNLPTANSADIQQDIVTNGEIAAPLKAGDKLGELIFFSGGKEFARVDLISGLDVRKKWTSYWWPVLSVGAFLVVFRSIRIYRHKSRRRNYIRRYGRQHYLR